MGRCGVAKSEYQPCIYLRVVRYAPLVPNRRIIVDFQKRFKALCNSKKLTKVYETIKLPMINRVYS